MLLMFDVAAKDYFSLDWLTSTHLLLLLPCNYNYVYKELILSNSFVHHIFMEMIDP